MHGVEERLEVLLDCDPADIELYRPIEPDHCRMRRETRVERGEVDAPAPMLHLGQAVRDQRFADRRGRGEDRLARRVEPADVAPDPFGGHARARRDVIGELGVIGRGERHVVAQAPAPGGDAERAFGSEVNRVGAKFLEHGADAAGAGEREADLGIRGTRQGIESVGRDHLDPVPLPLQHGANRLERADDAVDLGFPGIGHDGDAHVLGPRRLRHAASSLAPDSGASRAAISSAQWRISMDPS